MAAAASSSSRLPNPVVFKIFAILPKAPALLSMVGSGLIIKAVVTNRRHRRMTYHRIVGCLSGFDFVLSMGMFLGTWMIPRDPRIPVAFQYMAYGSRATCDAQGFLVLAGYLGVFLYQVALAAYYLIEIRQGWPANRVKRVETAAHCVISLVAFGIAAAGIPLQVYNSIVWACFINSSPLDCRTTHSCRRGENAWIYQWAWFHSFLYFSFLAQLVALLLVYHKVLQTERRNDRYLATYYSNDQEARSATRQREKSRRILGQALLYSAFFFVTFAANIISKVMAEITNTRQPLIILISAALVPLQGFWNYIIYNRPAYLAYRRRNPEAGCCGSLCSVMCYGGDHHHHQQQQAQLYGSHSFVTTPSTEFFGTLTRRLREASWPFTPSRTFQAGQRLSSKDRSSQAISTVTNLRRDSSLPEDKSVDATLSIAESPIATREQNEAVAAESSVVTGNGTQPFASEDLRRKEVELDERDASLHNQVCDVCTDRAPGSTMDPLDASHSDPNGSLKRKNSGKNLEGGSNTKQAAVPCRAGNKTACNGGTPIESMSDGDISPDNTGLDYWADGILGDEEDEVGEVDDEEEEIVFDWDESDIHPKTGTPWI